MDLRLPTQKDVLGFFEHLNKSKVTKDDAIHGLSAEIVKTWTKADCPPMTIKSVKTKFRLLLAEDKAAKSKNISHKAKKAKTGVPTQKSLRQNPDGNGQNNEDNSLSHEPVSSMPISPGPSQEDVPMPSSRTRSSTSSEKTFDVLFDILSQQKVDSGDTFDEAFYLVQKGPRK